VVEKPRPGSGSGERLTVRVAYAAIRELHGVRTDVRYEALLGGAILDEADEMVGSVLVVEFETREELDAWLTTDPYVTGGVWQEIEVQPYRPAVGAWVRDA
jgi:uncharacterized protein